MEGSFDRDLNATAMRRSMRNGSVPSTRRKSPHSAAEGMLSLSDSLLAELEQADERDLEHGGAIQSMHRTP